MKSFLWLASLLAVVALSSCTPKLSYFTQDLYDENQWSPEELKKIQFYLSEDLVLFRRVSNNDARITRGKVMLKNGQQIEEIAFKKNTPGVVSFSPKDNRIAVSFEDDDQRYLMFGPNPKAGERYTILARDWERRQGTVTYDNQVFNISSGDAFASLMIDLKRVRDTKINNRTARGRRID